jgi:hypothetical protein
LPAKLSKLSFDFFITLYIAVNFLVPEIGVSCRSLGPFATLVSMPETAMNKYNLFMAWQYNVGPTQEILVMEFEAISHPMQQTPDDFFRLCLAPLYARHDPASFFRSKSFRHLSF